MTTHNLKCGECRFYSEDKTCPHTPFGSKRNSDSRACSLFEYNIVPTKFEIYKGLDINIKTQCSDCGVSAYFLINTSKLNLYCTSVGINLFHMEIFNCEDCGVENIKYIQVNDIKTAKELMGE